MKILNLMLSRNLGGLEQAFLDYDQALKIGKFDVLNIASIGAQINKSIVSNRKLLNLGLWDMLSVLHLKQIIKSEKPNAIIAHGGRAIEFARLAKPSNIPLIGVAHGYSIKRLIKCDYIISLTTHMQNFLIQNGVDRSRIVLIPNMINIENNFVPRNNYKQPVVIGTMARFVQNKGIDVFLTSLLKLKERNYNFKAIIGGNGEEAEKLHTLSKNLGLEHYVSFIGWVKDKKEFFDSIDIFCLPSVHEPFGIIVLEAMKFCVPMVCTKTQGPSEIIRDQVDGLLCTTGSSDQLAEKLAYLIDNQDVSKNYAKSSYLRLQENYEISIVASKLAEFIRSI